VEHVKKPNYYGELSQDEDDDYDVDLVPVKPMANVNLGRMR
jgi:hypothetical protein